MSSSVKILCARDSPLSRAQVEEVYREILCHLPITFSTLFIKTQGDREKERSLRGLEKSDFFTRELDELLLEKKADLAVHSAKDLPEPLARGLKIAHLTAGLDPRDALVFRKGEDLSRLPLKARVGTSSNRRDLMLRDLRKDLIPVDIRGTIGERLALMESGEVDALVIAEAALIRLRLTELPRIFLEGESHPLQGKLALVVREEVSSRGGEWLRR